MTPEQKMEKARTILILDHYFFGHLTMKLSLSEDATARTAWTDGKQLVYAPEFIEKLTLQQCVAINAHEVMHCAMGHFWRGDGKELKKWNVACDYEINGLLLKENFELPAGVLHNPAFDGLSAEEIYHKLPDDLGGKGGKGKGGKGKGETLKGGTGVPGQNESESDNDDPDDPDNFDPGKCGGVKPQNGSKSEKKESEANWKASTAQAAQMAKKQGLLPAHLAIPIKEVVDPPLPWFVLLRDFVEKTARNDYNFLRPNRRYVSGGIILPSLISEELPEVCIIVDTSGSTNDIQGEFAKEASGVLSAYRTRIRLIFCDAKVHKEEVYSTDELPIKLKPIGGGGTSFVPAFDYVAKKGYTPSCIIYLTDLYGTFPKQEPEYPVMWVTPNDEKAPFGQTVKFNLPHSHY